MSHKKIRQRYNRFSLIYDVIEWPIEKFLFSKWRKKLFKNVKGKVLEIGVGTGNNLHYYNYSDVKLTATDISSGMLERAKRKGKFPVKFVLVNSEKLPFETNSFDVIINTFLLCSVSNQEKIILEMKRVLKPKGKILMLEHVLSKNKIIAFWENLHNPITRLFGFNINRDTLGNIRQCGLKIVKERNLAMKDVFKELEVKKLL